MALVTALDQHRAYLLFEEFDSLAIVRERSFGGCRDIPNAAEEQSEHEEFPGCRLIAFLSHGWDRCRSRHYCMQIAAFVRSM